MMHIKMLTKSVENLLQIIYPPICLNCETIIRQFTPINKICSNCLSSCQAVPSQFLQTQVLDRLQPCHIDKLFVVVEFNPTIQSIIHHIKYQKMNRLAVDTANWAIKNFLIDKFVFKNGWIIPIPLHPVREKERGYNQSTYIAKGFFTEIPSYIHTGLLFRTRQTKSQTELYREERQQNVAGAFRLKNEGEIIGKEVILVDDVITTGATMNECARVLKDNGVKNVYGLGLATPVD